MTCHTLIFPPFDVGGLAWVAPLPLLLLSVGWRLRQVIVLTWLIGTAQALLINGPWLWPAMREVFELPGPVIAAMLVLEAQIIGGLPFAALGALLHLGARLPAPAFVLYAPAAWVAVEYLRGQLPLAAPWALLGSALSDQLLPIQIADLGGVYAVSFLAALPAAAAVSVWIDGTSPASRGGGVRWGSAAVAGLLVAAALAYGAHRLGTVREEIAAAPAWRVALVHADIDTADRLAGPRALQNVDQHLALDPPAGALIDLIVWPENTVSVLLEDNPTLVARIAARPGAPHLVGGPRLTGGGAGALRASAFVIGAAGIEAVYDKRRLLPVAEQWGGGWRPLLGFGAGGPATPVIVGGRHLGTSICFEAVFPELARADVAAGAELLINVSNDSWFAHAAGPRLHFLLGRLRAVETRRAVLRVANGGITALVLPDGRVAAAAAEPGALVVSAPLLRGRSPYVRFGDLFAWLCVAATALGAARALPLASAGRG